MTSDPLDPSTRPTRSLPPRVSPPASYYYTTTTTTTTTTSCFLLFVPAVLFLSLLLSRSFFRLFFPFFFFSQMSAGAAAAQCELYTCARHMYERRKSRRIRGERKDSGQKYTETRPSPHLSHFLSLPFSSRRVLTLRMTLIDCLAWWPYRITTTFPISGKSPRYR